MIEALGSRREFRSVNRQKVRVQVPASTANLGPGFDTIGMALNLYAWIEMSVAEKTSFHLLGDLIDGVPKDKSNLIYVVAQKLFQQAGLSIPELEISMYSEIPLTRGLGSSASAIIGALVAANTLAQNKFSMQELFQMACQFEPHPDNIGASLYGGIIVACCDGQRVEHVRIEPDPRLELLVAIPAFKLSTSKAREVLPEKVSLKDAVFNVGHSSLLVAALATGKFELLTFAMQDVLHHPYRASLIPGMNQILSQATQHGALSVALSGAGPTMIAFVERTSSRKADLESFLQQSFQKSGIQVQLKWLMPSTQGVIANLIHPSELDFVSFVEGKVLR
jgi:homoserine kinase